MSQQRKNLKSQISFLGNEQIFFLESRAYIRQCLGNLFNLNPLEIPIIANPGEPPKLPKGMGHCSFSHCNDAIILVWHEKKNWD